MKTQIKFKLTPQAYSAIVEIADKLPKLVKTNPNGTFQMRTITYYNGGKTYTQKKEPVYVNHQVELISAFQQYGNPGVNKYVQFVNEIDSNKKI
jgi:hypothetical protein